jgi:hypothetical protein
MAMNATDIEDMDGHEGEDSKKCFYDKLINTKLTAQDLIEKSQELYHTTKLAVVDKMVGWDKEHLHLFAEEPIISGDQFMACKPWKGAVKPQTTEPLKADPTVPDLGLEFDFVHGFKSNECY